MKISQYSKAVVAVALILSTATVMAMSVFLIEATA
jgi:hypothetical protein